LSSTGTATPVARHLDQSTLQHNFQLLALLIRRELKVKYRGSVLGYLWSMLNPLLFMLIVSTVLRNAMKDIPHFDLYVLSGILFWNMTAHTLIGGTNSIVGNAGLIQKVKVPIWVFTLVPLGSALANLSFALVPYLLLLVAKGVPFPVAIVAAPLVLAVYAVFMAGISLGLATVNVFFRDVSHVMEPLLQLLFYATPIIYDRHGPLIPERMRFVLGLNPLARFVELFRTTVFEPASVEPWLVAILVGAAVTSLAIGSAVYRRQCAAIAYRL
jgi:ABC-type polysaccharide/polyol phosphate export permease